MAPFFLTFLSDYFYSAVLLQIIQAEAWMSVSNTSPQVISLLLEQVIWMEISSVKESSTRWIKFGEFLVISCCGVKPQLSHPFPEAGRELLQFCRMFPVSTTFSLSTFLPPKQTRFTGTKMLVKDIVSPLISAAANIKFSLFRGP